jgi:CheY-like chemotaxis protein/anti-sigma regulatory factor (Ser/Thr protein kinase)
VAHEINNPLSYVIANLAVGVDALAQISGAQETIEALREAQQGAERVRQIVRDLKTFSRSDDAPAGPVDLHRIIEGSINLAWNEIRHRARLVKDFARDLPPALGNEPKIGQVLLNLLVNAAHAIREGEAERNEIRISTRAAGRTVMVGVKDTGSGIQPEDLRRLFDPFFTTKPLGVGTGLGLFICQGIVRSLGGEIAVESEPGKGSSFRVTLPVANAPVPQAQENLPAPPPQKRGKILAIDDEPLVGAVLTRALAAHDVVSLTSATEALAKIRGGAQFDLIFCDLMMPHMTGIEFYAALQAEAPALAKRVIFLTGGAFTTGARDFLEKTPARTVEKPFDLKSIRALVTELLR